MNRLLAGAALVAFLAAMAAIAFGSAISGGGGSKTTAAVRTIRTAGHRTTTTVPVRAKAVPVKLTGAGAYDPQGDGHENNELAPLAVDGNPATFWKTEHYTHGFPKTGVGLVLDAGRRVPLTHVTVGTDGPGSSAQIELGDSPTGPFNPVSPARPLNGLTNFVLTKGAAGRFIVVWITALPAATGEAHVTEVHAWTPA
jgi:hypothetical protein